MRDKIQRAFVKSPMDFKSDESLPYRLSCRDPSGLPEDERFDAVVVNQALLGLKFGPLRSVFEQALGCLAEGEGGAVLVSGLLTASPLAGEDDPMQLLLHARSLERVDSALYMHESGLLLSFRRENPYLFSPSVLATIDFEHFRRRRDLDKLVPILSFTEFQLWLSNPNATRRFVRSLTELSPEELERRIKHYT